MFNFSLDHIRDPALTSKWEVLAPISAGRFPVSLDLFRDSELSLQSVIEYVPLYPDPWVMVTINNKEARVSQSVNDQVVNKPRIIHFNLNESSD